MAASIMPERPLTVPLDCCGHRSARTVAQAPSRAHLVEPET